MGKCNNTKCDFYNLIRIEDFEKSVEELKELLERSNN